MEGYKIEELLKPKFKQVLDEAMKETGNDVDGINMNAGYALEEALAELLSKYYKD